MLLKVKSNIKNHPLLYTLSYILLYFLFIKLKKKGVYLFSDNGFIKASIKYSLYTVFNLIFGVITIKLISFFNVKKLGGFNINKVKHWELFIFPLYIIVIGELLYPSYVLFSKISVLNWIVLIFWVFSIAFLEELMFRSFLQSVLIKKIAKNKKSLILCVLASSIIFGLSHLIKYNQGYYGEMAQVLYSFFIGFLMGTLLLLTRKIWPSILIHFLINIPSVLEIFVTEKSLLTKNGSNYTDVNDFIYLVVLTLPCFIYGMYFLIKLSQKEVNELISTSY